MNDVDFEGITPTQLVNQTLGDFLRALLRNQPDEEYLPVVTMALNALTEREFVFTRRVGVLQFQTASLSPIEARFLVDKLVVWGFRADVVQHPSWWEVRWEYI